MLYDIVFMRADRLPDQIFLLNLKVGDVIKVNMVIDDELEDWTITSIDDSTVFVEKR